jgi:virulence-associated protein VagC
MKRKVKKKSKGAGVPVTIREENNYAIIKPINKKTQKMTKKKKKIELQETKPQKKRIEEEREKAYKKIKESFKESPVDMIETNIDKLLEIVEKKESVNVVDVSKELKVNVEQIENWAKILEEHGLIEIIYPLIGFPRLRKKEWKKES